MSRTVKNVNKRVALLFELYLDWSIIWVDLQVDYAVNTEISKKEKSRLKEMQLMKGKKIQEILDAQNAVIDADMVSYPL